MRPHAGKFRLTPSGKPDKLEANPCGGKSGRHGENRCEEIERINHWLTMSGPVFAFVRTSSKRHAAADVPHWHTSETLALHVRDLIHT
jgi:hypothetical protein